MQCNAPCLYRVCVAGSNGSWCGRVRESCSALGRRLAIQVGVASQGTKTATNKKVLTSVCLSLFRPPPPKKKEKSQGPRETRQRWGGIATLDETDAGFGSAFVQWTDLLRYEINMQKVFVLYWRFARRHALVPARLRFEVYLGFPMHNTPVAQADESLVKCKVLNIIFI